MFSRKHCQRAPTFLLTILGLAALCAPPATAQEPATYTYSPLAGWSFALDGPDHDKGWDTAVDTAGNVYVTGQFRDTVDFDPGPGVWNLTSQDQHCSDPDSQQCNDQFVAKYDPSGVLLWARSFDYQGSSANPINAVAVDRWGNATVTLGRLGEERFSHLGADGTILWSHVFTDRVGAGDVAVDADGNIYIAGGFRETAVFGVTAEGQTISLTSAGDGDIFVAKYAPTGEVIWAQRAGSTAKNATRNDGAYGIAVDGEDIYLTGHTYVEADLGVTGVPRLIWASQERLASCFVCYNVQKRHKSRVFMKTPRGNHKH